jgi:pimeloyl-ACP methyl ester carboxylesterase
MITPPDNSSLYKSAEGYHKVMAHYDATLQKMDIPYETKYVETRFGPTYAIISGNESGKPIVLWHGLNANLTAWINLTGQTNWFTALAPTYRVYAIDAIGGMGKSAASRPSKTGPAYGQWAADALEGLGLKRANVIGISNGGWLIIKLASVAPEMISSAVLMSSGGFRSISKVQAARMISQIILKSSEEAARRMQALVSPPDLPPDPDTLEVFELMLGHFRFEQNTPVLSDVEIRRLAAPTYLMMGQYEVGFNPYGVIERGLSLLPNVITAEIVPGVGHMMAHKRPDWVVARVFAFLERYAV